MRNPKVFLVAAAALLLVAGASGPAWADDDSDSDSQRPCVPLNAEELETSIIIEINDTAGDAGIQMFMDGEGWDRMKVSDPDGEKVLDIRGKGSVGFQGITELFFESAEPSFDEQPLGDLLALFPEGDYCFRGRTTDGDTLAGEAELTHALPDAPVIVLPIDGDDEVDHENTVVDWMTVADPPGSEIVLYQVIVERDEDAQQLLVFSANIEPPTTEVTVPAEFLEEGTVYKLEVLAIEESGNQTITEIEFETDEV